MLETTVWSLTCVILLKQRDGSNGLVVDSRKSGEVTLKYSSVIKNTNILLWAAMLKLNT